MTDRRQFLGAVVAGLALCRIDPPDVAAGTPTYIDTSPPSPPPPLTGNGIDIERWMMYQNQENGLWWREVRYRRSGERSDWHTDAFGWSGKPEISFGGGYTLRLEGEGFNNPTIECPEDCEVIRTPGGYQRSWVGYAG
jgi:hypothetical protein